MREPVLNPIFAFLMCLSLSTASCLAEVPASGQFSEGKPRQNLWRSLLAIWPIKEKPIDMYAENNSLNKVCFRSAGQTYIFSLASGKAEPILHAKVLPPNINSITFDGDACILWHYGQGELQIGVKK